MIDLNCFYIDKFKKEYDGIIKKKSYKDIEEKISKFLNTNNFNKFVSGARINGSNEKPFIKKRLRRGGYRLYYLLDIEKEKIFLVFVHPKTGSLGYDNINDGFKKRIYKLIIKSIKEKKYYRLGSDNSKLKLQFFTVYELNV